MAKTMKAQVFYKPLDMKYEDVPVPEPADDEVQVAVKACGICGSDVAYYFGNSPLETESGEGPLILGHEFTGQVTKVGKIPAAKGLFKEGDRVVLDPLQYCYACDVCNRGQINLCENKEVLGVSVNGGFAEYCVSKYTSVRKLPDNITYERGALIEPLACASYALQNLQMEMGAFTVVMGAGAIGLMMMQLAKSGGAGKVALVDIVDYRLDIGKQLGADFVFNTKDKSSPYYVADLKAAVSDLTNGMMAARVVTPTGAVPAMEMALAISGRRSIIVFFGLPGADDYIRVPALDTIFWDKTIRFSWLAPLTWPIALNALSNELLNVDPLISHTFKLADLANGLERVKNKEDNVMKPVVVP